MLLNGIPGCSFHYRRGLQQGDPLSPLLFILCLDVLFRMLDSAANLLGLPSVGVGNARIHTLQYADDILLFFDDSCRSAGVNKGVLDCFTAASGLKINFGKSYLVLVHLLSPQAAELASLFSCPLHSFPFTYLGLPLSPKPPCKSDFLSLIQKVDLRLASWKGMLLSKGGRLVLLNSVLSSLPSFFCSVFRLLAWVITALDKIRRGFFWRGKKLANGFHCLVKWDQVCRPRRVGGIGIQNFRSMNSALLMKGLWKFYNSPSLRWVQLLLHKHYKFRTPSSNTIPTGCSPLWKGILSTSAPFL